MTDNNIFHDEYMHPDGRIPPLPRNWEEIEERLIKPIEALQVTEEDYRKFKKADAAARKEQQVTSSVFPIIGGGHQGC